MFFAVTPSVLTFFIYLLFPLGVYVAFKNISSEEEHEKYKTWVLLLTILLCADIVFYLLFRSEIEAANVRLLLLFHTFPILGAFGLSRVIAPPKIPVSTEQFIAVAQEQMIEKRKATPIVKTPPPIIVEKVSETWHGLILLEETKQGIQFAIQNKHFPLLLSGSAGNGRETIAKIISSSLGLKFLKAEFNTLVGTSHEETEAALEAFIISLKSAAPLLLYIPEVHKVFAWNRENWVSSRFALLVQELIVDGISFGITIVASTDNKDSMKEWMKQSECFEAVVEIPLPAPEIRVALAKEGFKGFAFEDEIEWKGFETNTLGRSFKDILWVIDKTKQLASKRANNPNNKLLKRDDLAFALEELLKNPP